MRKKNVTKQAVKNAAATQAAVKEEAVKATPAVEEVKAVEVAEEVKTEEVVKAEEAVKTETVEATEKKATKKPAAKKVAEKKEEMKPEVYIQFNGQEAVLTDVIEKAKKQFVDEGHRAGTIKSLQVYLKPEEYAAYYVINQKHAGRVDLF